MNNPIRILHILGRLDRGGAETMVMNLYRKMDRNQIQFDFMLHTAEECAYSEEVRSLGGKIYAVQEFRGSNLTAYRAEWHAFLQGHPEYPILHSHVRSTASLYLPIAKRYGRKTIIHSHNTSSGKGIGALAKTVLQYPLRYQADYLFACSLAAGEWLYGKKACESERFYLFKNAIDLKKFAFDAKAREQIRTKLGISKNTLLVGHIGRFEPQKNHLFLLEIFSALEKMDTEVSMVLLGEGGMEPEIRKRAGHHVCFAGVQGNVEKWLSAMDVFVFPSLFEGLPVTMIEAQAAGLPAVISDKITNEVILSENISQVSLNEVPELWAGEIMEAANKRLFHGENLDMLRKKGYDISESAEWLKAFYLENALEEKHV